jgi:hypothetical protein
VSRDSRYRAKYWDPEGKVYGIPTYWWRGAPEGLATRRQLRLLGLCPGGREPVAQVLWMRRRKDAVAYLYSIAAAKPRRVPTPAQLEAVGKALTARRTCPTCRQDVGYCIPTSLGECIDCHYTDHSQTGTAA